MADEYGDNVWEAELPEVWEGIRGRRLIREEGKPLTGAVWELPPGSRGVCAVVAVSSGVAVTITPMRQGALSAPQL